MLMNICTGMFLLSAISMVVQAIYVFGIKKFQFPKEVLERSTLYALGWTFIHKYTISLVLLGISFGLLLVIVANALLLML